jgi:hypothetical protein
MNTKIYLTEEQVKKITFSIDTLNQEEREVVRELLYRIRAGGIYREGLHRELLKLREKHLISEIDMKEIEADRKSVV